MAGNGGFCYPLLRPWFLGESKDSHERLKHQPVAFPPLLRKCLAIRKAWQGMFARVNLINLTKKMCDSQIHVERCDSRKKHMREMFAPILESGETTKNSSSTCWCWREIRRSPPGMCKSHCNGRTNYLSTGACFSSPTAAISFGCLVQRPGIDEVNQSLPKTTQKKSKSTHNWTKCAFSTC